MTVSNQSGGLGQLPSVKMCCRAAVEKLPSSQKSPNSSKEIKEIKEDAGEEEEDGTYLGGPLELT